MVVHYGKIVSFMCLLTILFCVNKAFAQSLQEPCFSHPDLLMDEKGKPMRVKAEELKKRVIHCEVPKLPGALDVQGLVHIHVLINPEGKVECAKAITTSGHPVAIKAAVEAAKKWTFKPLVIQGKPVAFLGVLGIVVSYDARVSEGQCKIRR